MTYLLIEAVVKNTSRFTILLLHSIHSCRYVYARLAKLLKNQRKNTGRLQRCYLAEVAVVVATKKIKKCKCSKGKRGKGKGGKGKDNGKE